MRQGILGRFEREETGRIAELAASGALGSTRSSHARRLLGFDALVEAGDVTACLRSVEESDASSKLALRVVDHEPTRVLWKSFGGARRFTASLRPFASDGIECEDVRLVIDVGVARGSTLRFELAQADPARRIEVELAGARDLEITLASVSAAPGRLWALFDEARLD